MRTDASVSILDACRSGFPVSARLPKTVAPLSSFHPWHRTLKPHRCGGSRLKGMTVRTVGSELERSSP
jgi:hypothetical protein